MGVGIREAQGGPADIRRVKGRRSLEEDVRAAEVRTILDQVGIRASRGLGQHFLLDEGIATEAVKLADIGPEDMVLEIGPGLGTLTNLLVEAKARLVTIEKSPALTEYLRRKFTQVQVITGDATRIPWPPFDKCVSNLPFNISSPVIFRLLGTPFRRAVLMVQWEFARRLVASPGSPDYSRLTVKSHYRADCQLGPRVPRGAFWPQPSVDAALVALQPRPPPFEVSDEGLYLRLVDLLFQHRRKKVITTLGLVREELGLGYLDLREIPYGERRPGELSPAELAEVSDALSASKL